MHRAVNNRYGSSDSTMRGLLWDLYAHDLALMADSLQELKEKLTAYVERSNVKQKVKGEYTN